MFEKMEEGPFIPDCLWEQLFNFRLSVRENDLVMLPLETLMETSAKYQSLSRKPIALLCIALGHPKATIEVLLQLAKRLGLDDRDLLFSTLALSNHKGVIKQLLRDSQDLKRQALMEWTINEAAHSGELIIFKLLDHLAPKELRQWIKSNHYGVYSIAAEKGHLHLLQYFEELMPQSVDNMVAARQFQVLRRAVSLRDRGQQEGLVNYLLKKPICLTALEQRPDLEYESHRISQILNASNNQQTITNSNRFFKGEEKTALVSEAPVSAVAWPAAAGHKEG